MKDIRNAIRNGEIFFGTGQEFLDPAIPEMFGPEL
jgi:hypothetical protein